MNTSRPDCPSTSLRVGASCEGFTVERVEPIPELRATALLFRHQATGAEVFHLWNDDVENVFSVNVRTPSPDSTGVAHILEHAVLAGSKRFPVRDAFNELGRSSFRTFLNAFTGRDLTCYPVASTLDIDFYNLAEVYFDLVFQPRLSPHTFMQEGHHLEVDDDGNLLVTGIVYNEMKGAFSSAERILSSTMLGHLYPDTAYGCESGGDPDHIPDLTYEKFLEYHRNFYVPSNARLFFYGSLPPERNLAFLGPRLVGLRAGSTDSRLGFQPRWTSPRQVETSYPASSEDELRARSFIQIAWLTTELENEAEVLALGVLSEALIGNAGAPLRRAMVESPHGTDLSPGSGFVNEYRDTLFSVGLRGSDPEHADALEALILRQLAELRDGALAPDAVEAAFHQFEVAQREIVRGSRPYGVMLMMTALAQWKHGLDPIAPLRSEPLNALRRRWRKNPSVFSELIDRWLISNPHRLRIVMTPDAELSQRNERARRDRVRARQGAMGAAELEEVRREAEHLRAAQNERDTPEALATLPRLELSDIPRAVRTTDTTAGPRTFDHEIFANGLGYVDLAFDASSVPAELRPDLPAFASILGGMGAGGSSYDAFAERKARYTRGVHTGVDVLPRIDGTAPALHLLVRTGALGRHVSPMIDILGELVQTGDLRDEVRLRTIVAERMSQWRAGLMPRGHAFTRSLAAAALSPTAALREEWEGVSHLRRLASLVGELDRNPAGVVARLETIRRAVLTRGVVMNLVGGAEIRDRMRDGLNALIDRLPEPLPAESVAIEVPVHRRVGIPFAGQVTHTTRAWAAPRYSDPDAPALRVANVILRSGFLYRRIRVRGGAYGGFSTYDSVGGEFAMMSYRDPHLDETFEAYGEARQAILDDPLDAEAMRKAIITAMAALDLPRDPRGEGMAAFRRRTMGVTDTMRAEHREKVLTVTAAEVKDVVARCLDPSLPTVDAAIAARERLEASPEPFTIVSLGGPSGR